MKRIFFILTLLSALCSAHSTPTGDTTSITARLEATEGVTIVQPEALSARLEKGTVLSVKAGPAAPKDATEIKITKQGHYQVEAYSDNSRSGKVHAEARVRALRGRFPTYGARLVFESPFWRVRVGPFKSRPEAEMVMAEIRKTFPAYSNFLRIVVK